MFDAVQPAPNLRFDKQQRIVPRQVDVFVGIACPGDVPAGDAPVVVLEIGQRHLQFDEPLEPRLSDRVQESPRGTQFGGLPVPLAVDEEGPHSAAGCEHLAEQNGAIQSPAKQNGDLRCA